MNTEKADILTRLRIEQSEMISKIHRERETKSTPIRYKLSNLSATMIVAGGVALIYFIMSM